MPVIDHDRVKEVFFEACLRPPADRVGFVADACAPSAELRAEVESLLEFYQGGDGTRLPAFHTERPPRFRRGQVLSGRFRIERLLGKGGMGEVYAAFDRVLGVAVALKTLRTADERHRARLHEEVRLTRRISHPAICRVYDVGEHDGVPFLTMELIVGEDLAARLKRSGPLPSAEAASIGARLALALAAAHDAGILHRDLKPANVLMGRDGDLHITDFGIATLATGAPTPSLGGAGAAGSTAMAGLGTPAYMAPEATIPGGMATEKTDLYSMGIVLYELLVGAPPFSAPDRGMLEEMHRSVAPEAPSRTMRGVDPRLEAWVLRLLAKEPRARPSTAREVADALAELDEDHRPRIAPAPEHRPLVALLCELERDAAGGARDDRERIVELQARCAAVCVMRGGRVAKHVERGLLVHFGYPRASERNAETAVRAALEILEQASEPSAPSAGGRTRLAIAVHAGAALFRQSRSGDVIVSGGIDDLERLRRMLLQDAVVVSPATLPLLREALTSERLETSSDESASGKDASLRVQVGAGRRSPATDAQQASHLSSPTPLVGRDLELAQLLRRWEDARAGHGQVVLVSGEAGIGKSRLLHELWSRISTPAARLQVNCRGFHRSSPLAPFLDLVRRAAGFEHADDDRARRRRLQALLDPLGSRSAEILDVFGTWLAPRGGSGSGDVAPAAAAVDSSIFVRALVEWIHALAAQKPLVLTFDDLQWSDPSSLEALDVLVQECEAARILLVLGFRSELSPRWQGSRISPIVLQPLRADEARLLVAASTVGARLEQSTIERIVASADGNPLFLEELVRDAHETGFAKSIQRTGGDGVPLTLMGLLQARLDRLGTAKLVAQAAAACGRSFRHDLLAALVGGESGVDLQDALDRLLDESLIHRRGTPPSAIYTFKQPLMREAIRGATPLRRQRVLHARLAELLPAIDPTGGAGSPEVVANHWMIAGKPSRAFPWWRQAGRRALERAAFAEALTHLENARAAYRAWARETGEGSPEVELEILIAMLSAQAGGMRYVAHDVRPILRRLRSVCARLDSGEALTLAHFYLVRFKVGGSDIKGLLPLLRRTEELANGVGDPVLLATVWSQMGLFLALQGRYPEAETYCERCLASDARATPASLLAVAVDPRVIAAYARSLCRWARGTTTELRRGVELAIAEADGTGHLYSRAYGRVVSGVPLLLAGQYDDASRFVREGFALAEAGELHGVVALGRLLEVLLESARGTTGSERVEGVIEAWEASGQRHLLGVSRLSLATALEREGQPEKALAVLEQECERAARRLSRFPTPELHRRRGELLGRLDRDEEAVAALRYALRLARRNRAVAIELPAAAGLARLLTARGAVGAATRVLEQTLAALEPGVDAVGRGAAEQLLVELRGVA
jgi:tetratricopeptide (TPR) repeat protein